MRDAHKELALAELGMRVLVVWECELDAPNSLEARLIGFLNPTSDSVGPA